MRRLTLATRIALIIIVALTSIWIVLLTLYFLSHAPDDSGARPAPARLAALAHLVDATPPDARRLLLAAAGSALFAVKIESPMAYDVPARPAPLDPQLVELYRSALKGRSLSITSPPAPRGAWLFSRFLVNPRNALEFRIGLGSGETLVVDTHNPILMTPEGVPAGIGAGLFGTIVALVALMILQRETRPLSQLAEAVDRLDLSGEFVAIPEARRSAPEIKALARAFNRLQQRLAALLKARMAMLGGISHDVRTFATRLRLRLDLIPDAVERDRAIADIADMIRLLDDALLASRAGAGELAQELVELDEILGADVADRQAQGAPVSLSVAPEAAGAALLGDRLALRRIAGNLIDNGLKYGGRVEAALSVEGSSLMLTVDDDGPGIPPDRREMLLEPFIRLETSRNRRTGGAGLGLAVVRNLAEGMGGAVVITEAPLGGARIMVRLPLFRPA